MEPCTIIDGETAFLPHGELAFPPCDKQVGLGWRRCGAPAPHSHRETAASPGGTKAEALGTPKEKPGCSTRILADLCDRKPAYSGLSKEGFMAQKLKSPWGRQALGAALSRDSNNVIRNLSFTISWI